jgi:CRISPR-associated protein Csm5
MNYRLQVSTVSPLHIGSGETMLRDYDFVTAGNQTWRLNTEAIWADEFDRAGGAESRLNERLAVPPGQLVRPSELREGSGFVRYALSGTTTIDQVREQIKTVSDECYLPGSTVKGALRTALMVYAIQSGRFQPQADQLGERRESAGQQWERAVFGDDPTHDLMRAAIVSDSAALPLSPSPLMLLNVQVFTGGQDKPGSPVVVEAIRSDVAFDLLLKVDDFCFGPMSDRLRLRDRQAWLESATLAQVVNAHSFERMRREAAFATERGLTRLEEFYKELLRLKPRPGQMLTQIGWGAGWTGKTVVPWVPKPLQDTARRKYKLGRPPKAGRDWEPNLSKPFPKSRRLRARRQGTDVVADVPLGWVLIEIEAEG